MTDKKQPETQAEKRRRRAIESRKRMAKRGIRPFTAEVKKGKP